MVCKKKKKKKKPHPAWVFLRKMPEKQSILFAWPYEAVEELEVDGRLAAVETGRVAKGVEGVELFVGGSTVEELEVWQSSVS